MLVAVAALLAATASAQAQGAGQEFLPDCSPSVTTDCVVSTELNGAPTGAIKANVAKQNGAIEGSYFQVYFTQSSPISYAPTFVCPDGTPAQTQIVDGQPALVCPAGGTPTPVAPRNTCPTGLAFGGYGNAVRCGDLTSVAPPGTKIGVTVNVGSGDPKVAVIRGGQLGSLASPNKTWTADKAGGSTVVKLETVLGTSSLLYGPDGNACRLFPTVTDCGGESAVAEWTGSWSTVSLLNLDSDQTRAYGEIARGATIATNAQSTGAPIFDAAKRVLSFQTGAPHFQKNGTTPNEGFIYTFLPDTFLQAGTGFGLPPGLTPSETLAMLGVDKITAGSATEQLEPNVSVVGGGAIYAVPKFGFSSPKFDYLPRKAVGAFTSKATATKKKVSVSLSVGGKSKVSVSGKLGSKSICSGSKNASKAGTVSVTCGLSSSGKKALAKAKVGSKVNVKVTLKAKKTETKSTYALLK
ncbi:MAG: hypothetical protein KGR19_09980 [Acidobacteria bacterium]|nr:hypothetical protein [Acidobacteriota bacterium]